MNAIGYIRVSTTEQASEGVSLENQAEKIRQYCELKGLSLIEVAEDRGISGSKTDRPGFQRVSSLCKAGEVQHVVIYSISRFTRSLKDLVDFIDLYVTNKKVALHSLCESIDTSTPAGRFVLTVLGAVAQLEREQTADRVKSAMQYKKSQGGRVGAVPYGYSLGPDGKSLIPDQDEQEILKLAKELHQGGYSYRSIGRELAARGYVLRGKTSFHPQAVKDMIKAA